MSIEAIKQALADARRNERHRTVAETRYWCDQYKQIATVAVGLLAEAEKKAQEFPKQFDTHQSKHKWVGLTDEEMRYICDHLPYEVGLEDIRAIEAKLKEKNT